MEDSAQLPRRLHVQEICLILKDVPYQLNLKGSYPIGMKPAWTWNFISAGFPARQVAMALRSGRAPMGLLNCLRIGGSQRWKRTF